MAIVYLPSSVEEIQAGNGGKGSFSYADTSVYGMGQSGTYAEGVGQLGNGSTYFWTNVGPPGSGGGARVNKILRYGSRALGFNPNGLVLVRIYKVD